MEDKDGKNELIDTMVYMTRDMSDFKLWWIDKKSDIIVWWWSLIIKIKDKFKRKD